MRYLPVFMLLFVVLGCGQIDRPKTGTETVKSTPAPDAPLVKISSSALVKAYKENEVAADDIYREKPLEVSGKVEHIAETFGSLTVDLAGVQFVSVKCTFNESEKPQIAKLKTGQTATLQGIGDGMTAGLYVGLRDCRIK